MNNVILLTLYKVPQLPNRFDASRMEGRTGAADGMDPATKLLVKRRDRRVAIVAGNIHAVALVNQLANEMFKKAHRCTNGGYI